MRILVLGGSGLLGHKVFLRLAKESCEAYATVRGRRGDPALRPLQDLAESERLVDELDARDWPRVAQLLRRLRPAFVVNCIGVVKQRPEAGDAVTAITINSLFPHRVAALLRDWDGRLLHFSTDCVFTGARGGYRESDPPDAHDLYGQSKALGEVVAPNALTLRTSFIGRELSGHRSLLDWFLGQAGKRVPGYRRVFWSGVTTNYLADLVAALMARERPLEGLFHVASARISKLELLLALRTALGVPVEVDPTDTPELDRSLDGSSFIGATGLTCPPWADLIGQIRDDPTPYPILGSPA